MRLPSVNSDDRLRGRGRRKGWTRGMTGFLVRMRRRGRSYGWIAKVLGLTRGECVARAVTIGLLLRPLRRVRAHAGRRGAPPALGARREIVGEGLCRWIAGDPASADWRMCAQACVAGTSWCAHHFARVFARVPVHPARRAR